MTLVNWPSTVNTKFYAFNEQPKDNTVITENLSGRIVGKQVNTRNIMTYACSLHLERKTELVAFWEWYNDTLGGLSGAFLCSALGDKQYRFTSVPSPQDTNQKYRELSLNIEEVY